METQTQIDRLIELAIIQRSELKQLVEQLPQLREHLNAEVERTFEEAEPQIRSELEEFVTRQAADKTATLGTSLEAKIGELAKSLEESAQAKYSALIATRDQNATLLAQAEERIAAAAGELPAKVKDIVAAELARFPRAGEIDQLRKEFAEPKSLNPRGKWQAGESYNKLDFVTINGDSYTSNIDGNRTRPSRSSADWTLVAARGTGGGGGPTSLSELTTVPSNGDILIGSGTSWVTSNLTAGAGISITVGAGEITISATDGDITLDDGTAASPSLHFTNDPDTGIYRPAANTLGISVSGTQIAYFDENGLTIPNAGVVAGGSFHGSNGNANNPTFSFSSDQDTGMYRHGTNELGFTIGGTEKAVLTSTTFTVTPNLVVSGTGTINGTSIPASKTLVVTTDKLSALAATTSAELAGVISDETGTGALVFATSPTLTTPILGTPQSGTLSSCTGLPISTGVSGLGTGVATFLATPSSANLASAVTDETGTGALVFANTPTLVTPNIGAATGTSVNLSGAGTFGGNLTVSGTGGIQLNSVANLTWGGSYGAGIPTIAIPSATSIGFYPTGTTSGKTFELFGTGNATLAGNLTVSGTGDTVFYSSNIHLITTDAGLWFNNTGTYTIGMYESGTNLKLRNGGSDRWTMDSSGNITQTGNLTVSGGTVTSGTGTLTLNSSANTVVLQSAGTTALTLDSSQNATFAGKITANGAGSTFKGTATNDNAAAGYVGEFVSSAVVSASAVSLTNATAANITSISLTAGDWDVTGLVQYNFTGATCSFVYHGFSSASASFGAPNSYVQDYRNYTTASVSTHNPSLTFRISLAATTTIYFVTQADFSAGTVAAYGRIQARRVR